MELLFEFRELFVGEVGPAGVVEVEERVGEHLAASGGATGARVRAADHSLAHEFCWPGDHQLGN